MCLHEAALRLIECRSTSGCCKQTFRGHTQAINCVLAIRELKVGVRLCIWCVVSVFLCVVSVFLCVVRVRLCVVSVRLVYSGRYLHVPVQTLMRGQEHQAMYLGHLLAVSDVGLGLMGYHD